MPTSGGSPLFWLLDAMKDIGNSSGNRKKLLTSESAVCFHCKELIMPSDILGWCDEDDNGVGQTAICPHCSVDAIVGFSGQIDLAWVDTMHDHSFR